MLRKMVASGMPMVWWLGLLLSLTPLCMFAQRTRMDNDEFVAWLDELQPVLYWVAWINGFSALFSLAIVVLLVLHIAGVL